MKNLKLTVEEMDTVRKMYLLELRSFTTNIEKIIEKIKATLKKLEILSELEQSVYQDAIFYNENYAKESTLDSDKISENENDLENKPTKTLLNVSRIEEIERLAKEDPRMREVLDFIKDTNVPLNEIEVKKDQKKLELEKPVSEIKSINYKRKKNILWSKYVIDVLKHTGYPLTVNEILNRAIKEFNLEEDELEGAFSSIHSALFRLKRNHKSVINYAIKGSRICYYGLSDWFGDDGKLLKNFLRP